MTAVESTPIAPALLGESPGAVDRAGIVLRGTLLRLRQLRPEDVEYLSEWAEDPFIQRMVGSEFLDACRHAYDRDPSFYEGCLTDSTQVVLMIEANHGWTKPVGLTRLFNIHSLEGYAFLEVVLTEPKAIRRGLGVEAGRLISFYGVDVLGLRRIEAKVYEYNSLSANSLRRNGFQQEGVLRKAGYHDGRYWDVLVFGILKDEINEQRTKHRHHSPPREGPP